jgi:hypothetical protein
MGIERQGRRRTEIRYTNLLYSFHFAPGLHMRLLQAKAGILHEDPTTAATMLNYILRANITICLVTTPYN